MVFKHINVIQYDKRLYENLSSLNKDLPSDDLPKTVDLCGTEVSLHRKSDCSEGILSDSVDSKSFLKNLVRNGECTGFLMWLSVFCMTCILNTQKNIMLESITKFGL